VKLFLKLRLDSKFQENQIIFSQQQHEFETIGQTPQGNRQFVLPRMRSEGVAK